MTEEKERHRRYSTISPNAIDIGAQSPSNEHIDRLAGILLTYNFFEKDLGGFSLCGKMVYADHFQGTCKGCLICVHPCT